MVPHFRQPPGRCLFTCLTVPIRFPELLCSLCLVSRESCGCSLVGGAAGGRAPPAAACCPTVSPMTVPRGSADSSAPGRGRLASSPPLREPLKPTARPRPQRRPARPPGPTDGAARCHDSPQAVARSGVVSRGGGPWGSVSGGRSWSGLSYAIPSGLV